MWRWLGSIIHTVRSGTCRVCVGFKTMLWVKCGGYTLPCIASLTPQRYLSTLRWICVYIKLPRGCKFLLSSYLYYVALSRFFLFFSLFGEILQLRGAVFRWVCGCLASSLDVFHKLTIVGVVCHRRDCFPPSVMPWDYCVRDAVLVDRLWLFLNCLWVLWKDRDDS